ncbi:hypothetical protein QVD17_31821 [Tagetes erecta]|uniref:Uncharacterized protein n=1 Tax=Tagetes erecta TaxID=13708 RepID=A0AAD8K6C8_TARER|nr:hypothetical protein QVD17_31821 [Tagetes erecta]
MDVYDIHLLLDFDLVSYSDSQGSNLVPYSNRKHWLTKLQGENLDYDEIRKQRRRRNGMRVVVVGRKDHEDMGDLTIFDNVDGWWVNSYLINEMKSLLME